MSIAEAGAATLATEVGAAAVTAASEVGAEKSRSFSKINCFMLSSSNVDSSSRS